MMPLSIHLFGPFEARVNGASLPRLRSRKGQWLLALLVLRASREVERGWLAGTLWPESVEPQGLVSLRTSLADLRGALGAEARRLRSPTPHTLALDLEGAQVDLFFRRPGRGSAQKLFAKPNHSGRKIFSGRETFGRRNLLQARTSCRELSSSGSRIGV